MSGVMDRYARLNVPRYTSYPTAASFTGEVSSAEQQDWLRALPPSQSLSVYLHVPYCHEICRYCGCNTKATRRSDVISRYRDALVSEIDRVGGLVESPLVRRIHWGGGTPSLLGADGLAIVLDALKRHFACRAIDEHAIELDPRLVTRSLAQGLASLGVNRASLGVQDVDPQVQSAIGRVQPIATVARAADHLREAGIARINFDLIYGLPHQSSASLAETCEAVLRLSPDRIAYYGYAHVPAMRTNQRLIDANALPSADERLAQIRIIRDVMKAHGYVAIGIDHFARPEDALVNAARTGRLKRNFQGYTDDAEPVLLGFGASSISKLPQGYVQNVSDPLRYVEAINENRLAALRGIRLSPTDWTHARIIEALMCDFRVDLSSVAPDLPLAPIARRLEPLIRDGLVNFARGVVSATREGRPFIRVIASIFDEFVEPMAASFSRAV